MIKTLPKFVSLLFCLFLLNAGQITAQSLPLDFEDTSIDYMIFGFGEATPEIIDNPDASGENTSAKVVQVTKAMGAETWAGVGVPLMETIDLSAGPMFRVKIWSPRADVPVLLKFEDTTSPPDANGNPSIITEVIRNTSTASAWEVLTYDMSEFAGYSADHNYNQAIVFPDFGNAGAGEVFYYDDVESAVAGPEVGQVLPLDFEDASIAYETFGFGDAAFSAIPVEVIANPDASGANTSAMVMSVEKTAGAQTWAGVAMPVYEELDISTSSVFTVMVWSPRAGTPIQLKIEDRDSPPDGDGNPSVFSELAVPSVGASAWEVVTFDMATAPNWDTSVGYDQMVLFPDFGTMGMGETFYFDDLRNASTTSLNEAELAKVQLVTFPNPVSETLNVNFDIPTSGRATLTIVNALGQTAQQVSLGDLNAGVYNESIQLSKMAAGNYFLLLSLDGQIVKTEKLAIR